MKILITGGSSGLGKSILNKLCDSNEIHFTYNSSKESAREITENYKNSYSYKCDFTNKRELEIFLSKIENDNLSFQKFYLPSLMLKLYE